MDFMELKAYEELSSVLKDIGKRAPQAVVAVIKW
ncbi:MAG: hypothetical protein CM15mP47_5260 [Methanobacteriota archaeon]|nr:MAG: hypothetical protein CM15mP47_5260 [Euryarchaeota archaeon]